MKTPTFLAVAVPILFCIQALHAGAPPALERALAGFAGKMKAATRETRPLSAR
jgi:hypothetical protein